MREFGDNLHPNSVDARGVGVGLDDVASNPRGLQRQGFILNRAKLSIAGIRCF
jgi:hypothetical protein